MIFQLGTSTVLYLDELLSEENQIRLSRISKIFNVNLLKIQLINAIK